MGKTKTLRQNATLDLTRGPIFSLIMRFCIPILLGNLMQQFYNMVDAAVVGKYVGTGALAAVGATGSITFLIIGFVNGLCSGFCIPLSRAFGGNDWKLLRRCLANILYLSVIFTVALTVGTNLGLRWLLTVMNTPADIFADSLIYLRLLFWGIAATVFYNLTSGIIRSLGNSRTPLIVLMAASVVNIVLDLVFVIVLHLDVMGVGIATVISQAFSGIACFLYILKTYPELRIEADEWAWDGGILVRLLLSGLPMALQYSITAIGSVLVQVAINDLGSLYVASVTAAVKVHSFAILPMDTLGATMAVWAGQNLGAGDTDRIKAGIHCGVKIAAVYAVFMGAAMFFLGEYVTLVFLDSSDPDLPVLMANARTYLRIDAFFYFFLGVLSVYRFSLQGLEHGIIAMFAGLFEMAARSIVAVVFAKRYGFTAICFANPAAWVAACILLIPAYLYIMPRVIRSVQSRRETGETGKTGETVAYE